MSEEFRIDVPTTVIGYDEAITKPTLLYQFAQTFGNGVSNGPFRLQITDPENPLFLFTYELSVNDFPELKEQLKLYCQFPNLSKSFYDLLVCCVDSEDYGAVINLHDFQKPKLLLQQKTKISLYTLFQIDIVAASEAKLNQYLSGEVKRYKSAFLNKGKNYDDLTIQLQETEKSMDEMEKSYKLQLEEQDKKAQETLQKVSEQYETRLDELQKSSKEALEAARQERQKSETEMTNKYEQLLNDLRKQNAQILEEKTQVSVVKERFEEKIKSLEQQLHDANTAKATIEAQKNELSVQLLSASSTSAGFSKEAETLKEKITLLEKTVEHDKDVQDSQAKIIEGLQADVAKKDEENAQIRAKLSENEDKARQHDWIAAKSKQVIEKFMAEAKELNLQIAQLKSQLDERTQQMTEMQVENAHAEERIKALNDTIDRENAEMKELRTRNDALQKQIAEMKDKSATDEITIQHLNKRLNEHELENPPCDGFSSSFKGGSQNKKLLPSLQPIADVNGAASVWDSTAFF